MALWVESELWPNLILSTQARGVPLVLVNGRLSARSYRRWQRWPGLICPILGAFDLCLAQDDRQAQRFRSLGACRVAAVGDLKAAAAALPVDLAELLQLQEWVGARPLWLAASTHAGEEEIAGRAHHLVAAEFGDLLTIIVPRHPARADDIAGMLASEGLRVARRTRGEPVGSDTDVYLADTMGELGLFYRLAEIVFVGGSLAAKGGHNPFEAARLECAVLHGPDMSNCVGMAAALAMAGAAETVTGAENLARAVARLLANRQLRAGRAAAAMGAAAAGLGIVETVLDRLAPWLDQLAPARDIAAPARSLRA